MTRITLTKQDLKDRSIPVPINRSWKAAYYEEDGRVFCVRGTKDYTETLVLCMGNNPLTPSRPGVSIYWSHVSCT